MIRRYRKIEKYSVVAQIYDYMMRHVNYSGWANYVRSILRINDLESGDIIDISCGTGSLLKELKKLGYNLYGSDQSRDMLVQAKLKCNNPGIKFQVMDMRNLCLKKRFDAVVSLFDSLNYLTIEDDILKCLNSVEAILSNNGLFIFDICTEANSLNNFINYIEKGEYNRIYYQRKSYYINKERIQINNFKIINKKTGKNYRETHRQRIYYPEEITAIIDNSSLKLISMYDDLTLNPPTSKTERIHFVLKK